MSTHMKRKHPGELNAFEMLKDTTYINSYGKPRPAEQNIFAVPSQNPNYSNSFLPPIDWSDPIVVVERSTIMRMLLDEIRKLSKMERTCLMAAIVSLP